MLPARADGESSNAEGQGNLRDFRLGGRWGARKAQGAHHLSHACCQYDGLCQPWWTRRSVLSSTTCKATPRTLRRICASTSMSLAGDWPRLPYRRVDVAVRRIEGSSKDRPRWAPRDIDNTRVGYCAATALHPASSTTIDHLHYTFFFARAPSLYFFFQITFIILVCI